MRRITGAPHPAKDMVGCVLWKPRGSGHLHHFIPDWLSCITLRCSCIATGSEYLLLVARFMNLLHRKWMPSGQDCARSRMASALAAVSKHHIEDYLDARVRSTSIANTAWGPVMPLNTLESFTLRSPLPHAARNTIRSPLLPGRCTPAAACAGVGA
jgi:hypothetical protein